MTKLILILLLGISFFYAESQKLYRISTEEIATRLETKGIDSALASFDRDLEIYLLDTGLALRMAYACSTSFVMEWPLSYSYERQHLYLKNLGQHIKDDTLNLKLLNHLHEYRTLYKKIKKIPSIDFDGILLKAIIFQNKIESVEKLQIEYQYWKTQADSIGRLSEKKKNENRNFDIALYNASDIRNTITTLQDANSNTKQVQQKNHVDTLTLSRNYSSLTEIDYITEPGLKKIYFFSKPDTSCLLKLVYNKQRGIIDVYCFPPSGAELGGFGYTFHLELISKNRIVVTYLRGRQS